VPSLNLFRQYLQKFLQVIIIQFYERVSFLVLLNLKGQFVCYAGEVGGLKSIFQKKLETRKDLKRNFTKTDSSQPKPLPYYRTYFFNQAHTQVSLKNHLNVVIR
jgi:hypothetical protein